MAFKKARYASLSSRPMARYRKYSSFRNMKNTGRKRQDIDGWKVK